jgi:hypothetical protein
MGCGSSSTATDPTPVAQSKPSSVVQVSAVEAFDTADESDLNTLNNPTTTQNTAIDWDWKPANLKAADSDAVNKARLISSHNASDQNTSGFPHMDPIIELQDFEETEFDAPAVEDDAPVSDGRNSSPANLPR